MPSVTWKLDRRLEGEEGRAMGGQGGVTSNMMVSSAVARENVTFVLVYLVPSNIL